MGTAAAKIFSDPFYSKGPNDQGIGWNVLTSLKRVGIGFGLAALVGIPLGFMIGRFRFLSDMAAPIIALLRPVSPLAWLPIGLLVFKAANPAAIYVIFICSLWPMIINTAVGVRQIPQDYLNVARVLNLSEWKVFTKILFPAVLPYMITGVRLSIGVAWLVIVAAEMLTGGVGIGFWVWDEWNNLKVEHIIIAIFTIGIVGLLLEQALMLLARRFSYGNLRDTCSIEDVGMTFDTAGLVAHRHRPDGPQGRVRLADRPLRLRQVARCSTWSPACSSRPPARSCSPGARSPARGRTAAWCSRTTRCCRGSPASTTSIWRSSACFAEKKAS